MKASLSNSLAIGNSCSAFSFIWLFLLLASLALPCYGQGAHKIPNPPAWKEGESYQVEGKYLYAMSRLKPRGEPEIVMQVDCDYDYVISVQDMAENEAIVSAKVTFSKLNYEVTGGESTNQIAAPVPQELTIKYNGQAFEFLHNGKPAQSQQIQWYFSMFSSLKKPDDDYVDVAKLLKFDTSRMVGETWKPTQSLMKVFIADRLPDMFIKDALDGVCKLNSLKVNGKDVACSVTAIFENNYVVPGYASKNIDSLLSAKYKYSQTLDLDSSNDFAETGAAESYLIETRFIKDNEQNHNIFSYSNSYKQTRLDDQ